MKKWTVKPEYRTKTDAKIAVVYLAGKDAIEFVRFRGEPVPPDHDPFKPYKRAREPQTNDRIKKEDTIPPTRPVPGRLASSLSDLSDRPPLLETKEEGLARQKAERERRQEELQKLRPVRRDYYSRRSAGPAYSPSPSSYGGARNGGPYHDLNAAATAVIDRVTGASSSRPAEYPLDHRGSSSGSHHAHSNYAQPSYEQSRDSYDHASHATPPHPQYAGPQSPPIYPPTHPHYSPAATSPIAPSPASHYPRPPPNNVQYAYASGAYSPNYEHPTYPYPMHSHPPTYTSHGYALTPPPTTSPPEHSPVPPPPPSYPYPYVATYYADPRYGQYPMPGMAVPYAVALPPTPNYGYPSSASGGPPAMPGHWPIAAPTLAPVSAEAGPSSASGRSVSASDRDSVSMRRSTSVDIGERPKRPRSRQGTPEDAARPKKQRPESLPSPVSIKQESAGSRSPAPPTPVSEPEVPSSVEQLKGLSVTRKRPYGIRLWN